MYKIIYTIPRESLASEISWLNEQKIFPCTKEIYYWEKEKWYVQIGVIVGKEAALSIKLRHNLDLQAEYRQK